MIVFNNISSDSSDKILAALSNDTELAFREGKIQFRYPITDKDGNSWHDADTAYQAFKTGKPKLDKEIMTRILKRKFQQHRALFQAVSKRGGAEYLRCCSHLTKAENSFWEGIGTESNFICCLVKAYELAEPYYKEKSQLSNLGYGKVDPNLIQDDDLIESLDGVFMVKTTRMIDYLNNTRPHLADSAKCDEEYSNMRIVSSLRELLILTRSSGEILN